MLYRIVQYIQPWEIDDLERQVHCMIPSTYHIDSSDTVVWDITMNISDTIVDWNNSQLPKEFFVNKFKYLEKLVKQYFVTEFDTDNSIQGCTDKRRVCSKKKQDFIIWLDSDMYFSKATLPCLINSSKVCTDDYFFISPQIIKYWDSSWDVLVNNKFINEPFNHRDYFDSYSIDDTVLNSVISIKLNKQPKFGGGWFNLFKSSAFEAIPLPAGLKSYGDDDTYFMYCCGKHNVQQYILDGIFVTEIGNRYLEGKDYLKSMLSVNISDKAKLTFGEVQSLVKEYWEA
tara:strand:- start:5054 stop:5911 length:858 start_codon:yes stop_codon:yes gene_type:complete